MFRICAMALMIAAVVVAVLFGRRLAGVSSGVVKRGRFPLFEGLLGCATWVSVLVLAWTGFFRATFKGHALDGYSLLVHVMFGGLFACSLAALAVFRGEAYRFGEDEKSNRYSCIQKLCFWVIVVCGLGLIGSILLSMLRVLGTDGQHLAILVHRYVALVAFLSTVMYAGTFLRRA